MGKAMAGRVGQYRAMTTPLMSSWLNSRDLLLSRDAQHREALPLEDLPEEIDG